ncbi:hypothetical protein FPOAC2_03633 [Fusarium poae]|uniref:F-box domain-containing protein n=1 Tax=Fusarium poae TaxID=36050 RepID=A0A1B8B9L3_FUSPO|nr:hypothetical protein FPOAC1_003478 [Fusarium poae]KAG8677460.1 hypothetical protein FPOAC1_003478 [Fusarium poae]OBS29409.1 hypothetical protein FPOA_03346 [Fusarium poae]
MAFQNLPTEILLMIGERADDKPLQSVCLTCRRFMDLFYEMAFHTAKLDDTPESAKDILALVSGSRNHLIRKIHYTPRDPWGRSAREIALLKKRHPGPVQYPTNKPYMRFANETDQAFDSLEKLGLGKLKFQFDLRGWDLNQWREDCLTVNREIQPYYEENWLEFIEASFKALARIIMSISHLEINGLPHLASKIRYYHFQPFKTVGPVWSITTFEISLAEVNERFEACTNAHRSFVWRLPRTFFRYLTDVQNLKIMGTENAVIESPGFEAIAWDDCEMKWLESFEIEYSHITDELLCFLYRRVKSWKKLCFRNCFGERKRRWLDLIQMFLHEQPTKLVEFEIVSYPVRLRHGQPDYFEKGDVHGYGMSKEAKKEKMRRFVVGKANLTIKNFEPAEIHADDDDPELDESDVIERWKELEGLMERNKKRPAW